MIVTSKRCFINCVAQFMDHHALLESNYYICDVSNRSGRNMGFNRKVEYDDSGEMIIRDVPFVKQPSSISRFHVEYSDGIMDPSMSIINSSAQIGVNAKELSENDCLKIYQQYLMEPTTIYNVYYWLYGNTTKPRGNGLVFLIINDEKNTRIFGHTICEYLSKFFGEDVEFIDPQMRPQLIPGYAKYPGDKRFAEKVLRDMSDYKMCQDFIQMLSTVGMFEATSNLQVHLDSFNDAGLIRLYELLFRDDPLPPGNYTSDQLKKIIIGKAMDRLDNMSTTASVSNVYTSNTYLESVNAEFERLCKEYGA